MATDPTPVGKRSPVADPNQLIEQPFIEQPFEERDLPALRRTVAAHGDRAGLSRRRVSDLVLIVSELAGNAIRHGGGRGRLRLWRSRGALYCEVSDHGP